MSESSNNSPRPSSIQPSSDWEHFPLYQRVREALLAVPSYFQSEISLSGINATDIFSFNAALGTTIEDKVVDTLNRMRSVWDPDDKYALYFFERQAQTFPDVLLRKRGNSTPIIGIELKGWYLLAKEKEPSFRYCVTPAACAEADLLAVYPWYLSEVISGEPKLMEPYLESARYVALYRNWHWENGRKAASNPVILSGVSSPYPSKSDPISDKATRDKGGNFGRIARVNLMEDFKVRCENHRMAGIPASMWLRFLILFKDSADEESISQALTRLETDWSSNADFEDDEVEVLVDKLRRIAEVLR